MKSAKNWWGSPTMLRTVPADPPYILAREFAGVAK